MEKTMEKKRAREIPKMKRASIRKELSFFNPREKDSDTKDKNHKSKDEKGIMAEEVMATVTRKPEYVTKQPKQIRKDPILRVCVSR